MKKFKGGKIDHFLEPSLPAHSGLKSAKKRAILKVALFTSKAKINFFWNVDFSLFKAVIVQLIFAQFFSISIPRCTVDKLKLLRKKFKLLLQANADRSSIKLACHMYHLSFKIQLENLPKIKRDRTQLLFYTILVSWFDQVKNLILLLYLLR